jgi:SAM-dependent methyltransferase
MRPRTRRPESLLLAGLLCLLPACAGAAPSAPPEASVRPGINANYLDPALDVDEWVARFEGESREIFVQRLALAAAVHLQPGDDVADVGAGTGLFLDPFASAVGTEGKVYAVDISPVFIEHLEVRARELDLPQVVAHLCREDSVDLPAGALDKAFICDTYHHFEYPRSTMASLHKALRKGGEVVIVDFERIPGVSRDWVLEHVRCGKEQVIGEVTGFGFELVEQVPVAGLAENYVLRFAKR